MKLSQYYIPRPHTHKITDMDNQLITVEKIMSSHFTRCPGHLS